MDALERQIGKRMTEIWQKVTAVLLAAAVAAAFTLGQHGLEPGQQAEMTKEGMGGNAGMQKDERAETEKEPEPGKASDENETAKLRVAREGKLVQGWQEKPCIVLDPGHGGYDPGKIGINDCLEKDVNLAIACRLREYLEAAGVKVSMTRQEDVSLGEEGEENKKVRDLKHRIEIIETAKPVAAVSIHQNSYPENYVTGAQVFYYVTSTEGKKLAQHLQDRLIRDVDPENDRQIKDNNTYFLLKKTAVPLVIVECGFLSNWEEAELLCSEEYQDRIAWAVYLGVMDYLEECAPAGTK